MSERINSSAWHCFSQNFDEQRGAVILAASFISQRDQARGSRWCAAPIAGCGKDVGNRGLRDGIPEAIAAQQQAISGLQWAGDQINFYFVLLAQRAIERVAS